MKTTSILFAGIGGQGIIKASSILATACLNSGFDVKQSEVHGMAQRGGSVVSFVRFGEKVYSPTVEQKTADIILSFEKSETLRWIDYLKSDGFLLINDYEIRPTSLNYTGKTYPERSTVESYLKEIEYKFVNSTEEALKLGDVRVFNTILLGVIAKKIESISIESFHKAIELSVPSKTIQMNLKAFDLGLSL
ncbi:indolepyruvate oxidoreductase subunit beta [bacterium]|nr:indolepyruvate oxidoreductase subunit beta [bacterium]